MAEISKIKIEPQDVDTLLEAPAEIQAPTPPDFNPNDENLMIMSQIQPPVDAQLQPLATSGFHGIPGSPMYKNDLQSFTQRFSMSLPIYQTVNEGLHHAPEFRSTVFVSGETYTSTNTYLHRKAAEQEAAKLALNSLAKKVQEKALSLIHEDAVSFKMILNEYAMKKNLSRPLYFNYQLEGPPPVSKASVLLNDVVYIGSAGTNKKDAERSAAQAAILSLLGTSLAKTTLSEIIVSKDKLFDIGNADGSSEKNANKRLRTDA